MKKLLLLPIVVALLSSCAIFSNPALSRIVFAGAVSAAIEYGVPKDQRAQVAQQITAAGALYNSLAGPEGIPTPEQFAAALETYLPNNSSKTMAIAALTLVYSTYYPEMVKNSPKDQLVFLQNFLAGAVAGAAPYLK